MAMLYSLPILQDKILGTPIDGQLPFDHLFKPIANQLDPIPYLQALNRY